jgi:hypothetical protein
MPMHDWTRVDAGVYHDFHNAWITELRNALNDGLLPRSYYALGEQRAGDIGPDVLTLHGEDETVAEEAAAPGDGEGMIAVAEAPPRVRLSQEADEAQFYLARQRSVVIRHVSGDRIVAFIEIVSPANKHSPQTVEDFVTKVAGALRESIHVLVIDPFPPGNHDSRGMHGAVWEAFAAAPYEAPEGLPLTLVSYRALLPAKAYVEPVRVGIELIEMPLFLTSSHYIPTPLEPTYQRAWRGVPQRWRRVIEGTAP